MLHIRLVEIADSQCRSLLKEAPGAEAVKAVRDLIIWLNKESEIENNFSASLNSYSLGGIASGRYIPTTENKMIERFWINKYDIYPKNSEKKQVKKVQNDHLHRNQNKTKCVKVKSIKSENSVVS